MGRLPTIGVSDEVTFLRRSNRIAEILIVADAEGLLHTH
jgi:hypothetical protein